jgi:uncharacterized membrane protein
VPLLIAVVLFLAVVVVSLVGLGSPSPSGNLPPHTVTVAGTDPTSGSVVRLDLAHPVVVNAGPGAPSADLARLSLSILGVGVSDSSAPLVQSGSAKVASIDAKDAHYLVAGLVTAKLELLSGATVVSHWSFAVRTSQTGILSLTGGVSVLLLLFAGAYFESSFRVLRKGRRRVSSAIGIVVMGALSAVAAAGVLSLLAGREITVTLLVVCAALGAAAGASTAVGGLRMGRRRKFRRAQRREQPS